MIHFSFPSLEAGRDRSDVEGRLLLLLSSESNVIITSWKERKEIHIRPTNQLGKRYEEDILKASLFAYKRTHTTCVIVYCQRHPKASLLVTEKP